MHKQNIQNIQNIQNSPIGVFDSGIGGLSVLRHLRQLLPNEFFIYFADSSYAPYGDKTEEQIKERSLKITQFLINKGIKALVVACNTATATAIELLRTTYPDLIIIGIEPGLKPAALQSQTRKIGVLATRRTLESKKFIHLSEQLTLSMQVQFFSQACVGLVDLIEQGDLDSDKITQLLHHYLAPLLAQEVDSIVLGCTHYPFVSEQIKQVIRSIQELEQNKNTIQLIDTGIAVAKRLHHVLKENALLCDQKAHEGTVTLFGTSTFENGSSKLKHLIPNLENQVFSYITI